MLPIITIKKGSKGTAVIAWQDFLKQKEILSGTIKDGDFDDSTDTATKSFQKANNLAETGIVDKETYLKAGFNIVTEIADFIGIDVFENNGVIHWEKVRAQNNPSIKFAYFKATEGAVFFDRQFAYNRNENKCNGFYTGAYHFYSVLDPGKEQANAFLKTIGSLGKQELPPVLAIQPKRLDNISQLIVIMEIKAFLKIVKNTLNVEPIIYTNYHSWVNVLGNCRDFSDYKLWVADYQSDNLPNLFGGWKDWAIWQYDTLGKIDGVDSYTVNLNKYNVDSGLIFLDTLN